MLIIVCGTQCILKLALPRPYGMKSEHEILNIFGENVKKYRRKLNISQEELASRADLHRTYIGMIERAEKNITLVNMEKIAKALEVKIKDLLKHSNNGNSN
jgi:predicted transcriptional regulator